ncbi:MAG: hypothetical protein HN337_08510 [Deltaproteobacteria bacterium]|jgi:hypothetical protein|nr:hypothetical protein [Deltaproteobacteria bacterium]
MVHKVDRSERVRQDKVKERQKEAEKTKPKDSDFNEVLRKSKVPQQPMIRPQTQSKTATEYALKEAVKHQEKKGDENKKEDRDDKEEGRDSRQEGKKPQGKIAQQKVIAKGKLKQGNQQSGGKGQRGFGGGNTSRKGMAKALKKAGARSLPIDLKGKFASKLSDTLKATAGPDRAQLTQQVLNQLIQYVKVGMNRKGEKEIQIDLHEKIFKGLKLRVISREGKVAVTFSASDRKGREILEKNKDDISRALKDKGIEVDEIVVN